MLFYADPFHGFTSQNHL